MKATCLVVILFTLPLAAQKKNLSCDQRDGGTDRSRFCEMREQTVPSVGRLAIDGGQNGGISVKGWDRAEVLVRAQVQSSGASDGDARSRAAQVIVHASGGQVSADGPSDGAWSVSYEVFVPHKVDLNLTGHNGGIHIEEVRGRLEFTTVNGGVHLAQVSGEVKGHTQNGGVHVELSGSKWDGAGLDVTTQNGGVHLAVPAQYSAHVETGTVNGSLKSDFTELVREPRRRDLSVNLGAGGATLRVITQNGGVTIQRI